MPVPSSRPTSSGSDSPPLRTLIMADTKSWTAPAKMVPSTIHRKAAGPNIMPMMAPKMGPRPAMLRNCMRNTRQVGSGMKSTPSRFVSAGIGRFGSTPTMRSTTAP